MNHVVRFITQCGTLTAIRNVALERLASIDSSRCIIETLEIRAGILVASCKVKLGAVTETTLTRSSSSILLVMRHDAVV